VPSKDTNHSKVHEPEARSCLSALKRLEELLHGRSRTNQGDIHVEEKIILDFLLHELFSLISSHFRSDIHDAVSRCLGEIALYLNSLDFTVMDITSSGNNFVCASDDFASNPPLQIQTSAVELLAKLIQSDDVETAIVVKDTINNILMTEDSIRCCREIECLDLKRLISPLARKKGHKSDIPEITDAFYTSILSATDKVRIVSKTIVTGAGVIGFRLVKRVEKYLLRIG